MHRSNRLKKVLWDRKAFQKSLKSIKTFNRFKKFLSVSMLNAPFRRCNYQEASRHFSASHKAQGLSWDFAKRRAGRANFWRKQFSLSTVNMNKLFNLQLLNNSIFLGDDANFGKRSRIRKVLQFWLNFPITLFTLLIRINFLPGAAQFFFGDVDRTLGTWIRIWILKCQQSGAPSHERHSDELSGGSGAAANRIEIQIKIGSNGKTATGGEWSEAPELLWPRSQHWKLFSCWRPH